jgi:hypothetical protein
MAMSKRLLLCVLALALVLLWRARHTGYGPDGQVLHVWDCGRWHAEIETIPSQPTELFVLNRVTDWTWDRNLSPWLLPCVLGFALALLWQRNRANLARVRPPYVREG